MILPTLRGYYTSLGDPPPIRHGNCIRIGCAKCKCQRVIYHQENCNNMQTRFPAFCLKCGSMIVVEVRKVEEKEVMRVKHGKGPKPKPPVKKPAVVGGAARPKAKKQPWT